jgi:hypothetical protein
MQQQQHEASTPTLGRLASGEVVVDRYNSHLHESVLTLLPEALSRVESAKRRFIIAQVDFDRVVGESVCVATGPGDQIVYAQRPKRFGLSRFVKNRKPEAASSAVVILKMADGQPGAYALVTAFIGKKAEPEPWDRNATANSRAFWSTHALLWGSEPVIDGTETPQCPW